MDLWMWHLEDVLLAHSEREWLRYKHSKVEEEEEQDLRRNPELDCQKSMETTCWKIQNEFQLVIVMILILMQLPFTMVIDEKSITMIESVVSNGNQAVYNKNHTEIETQLPPESSIVNHFTKTYGAPHRGRKENIEAKGPRGASAAFEAVSVAKNRFDW